MVKQYFKMLNQTFLEINELENKIEYFNKQFNERTDYESQEYLDLINQFNETKNDLDY